MSITAEQAHELTKPNDVVASIIWMIDLLIKNSIKYGRNNCEHSLKDRQAGYPSKEQKQQILKHYQDLGYNCSLRIWLGQTLEPRGQNIHISWANGQPLTSTIGLA